MKKRKKVILVKAYILFCACWLIYTLVSLGIYEIKNSVFWEKIAIITCILYSIFVVFMVFIMSKVDISPDHAEPEIKKLMTKTYEEFNHKLFLKAGYKGFCDEENATLSDEVETTISYKDTPDATYVLETVKMDDFSQDDVEKATEYFWENAVNRIGEKEIERRAVALIQCICVKRMNSSFRNFVHQNVQQGYKRYQILAGVSFGGKKAYICQTKGGFFRSEFRYLGKMFDELTEELLIPEEESSKKHKKISVK